MRPKKSFPEDVDAAALPFDVTQEIEPSLVDEILRQRDPTLTQADFDDVTVVLPQKKPKR